MEVRKSRLEDYTREEKKRYFESLRDRIRQGYMTSDKVLGLITERLAGTFEEELAKY